MAAATGVYVQVELPGDRDPEVQADRQRQSGSSRPKTRKNCKIFKKRVKIGQKPVKIRLTLTLG